MIKISKLKSWNWNYGVETKVDDIDNTKTTDKSGHYLTQKKQQKLIWV